MTVLHWTASLGKAEVARALLENGVAVDVRDSRGETPLHRAAGRRNDSLPMLRLLLRHQANVRAVSNAGWEPIHHAAQARDARAVGLLVDHKADVNVREKEEGRTPLHLAIEAGAFEARALPVVRQFLQHQADLTLKDRKGRTPLALAEEMKYTRVAELLRKHGAKK